MEESRLPPDKMTSLFFLRSFLSGSLGAVLLAMGISCLSAQELETKVVPLDYRKAIEMALMQNFEIRIERYAPKAAAAQLQSARGPL